MRHPPRPHRAALVAFAAALVAAACSSPGTGPREAGKHSWLEVGEERTDFDAARDRWRARGPERYSVIVGRACECLPEVGRSKRLVVRQDGRGGEVVESATFVEDGQPVPAEYMPTFAVEGLFGHIEGTFNGKGDLVLVEYDDALGYPRRVVVNYDEAFGNDDELIYSMTELTPLP